MDITLLKTFLEVSATGSFVSASDRLFVTQSAVSLRIQRLEDVLGKKLFVRSKGGAEHTPAGHEFEKYANSMILLWEEARQQVAIPEGFSRSLTIGAQYSLWPRLGFRWIDRLRLAAPDLSIRAELGMPDRLTRFLVEGVIQAGLMYNPQIRPGLIAEKVLDDELVLVASWPDPTLDLEHGYVYVDWGPEFLRAHAVELPHLTNPGLTLALGAMAADYVARRRTSAYVPARYALPYVEAGQLWLVPEAPRFPYPVWALWRSDLDESVAELAQKTLHDTAQSADADKGRFLGSVLSPEDYQRLQPLGEQ